MERNTRYNNGLDVETRSQVMAGFMTRVYQWMATVSYTHLTLPTKA